MKLECLIFILYTTITIEIITAIIGTIYYYKYKKSKLKDFIFILWYTALNELIGGIILKRHYGISVEILYNIFYLINFLFYFYLYSQYLEKKQQKTIYSFIFIYLASIFLNLFYQNYLNDLQTLPYIIAATLLIVTIMMYFYQILKSEKVLMVHKNLLFWISVGLLLNNAGNIPFRILRNYYSNLTDATVSFLLSIFLANILNLCFIIGFICSNRKQLY